MSMHLVRITVAVFIAVGICSAAVAAPRIPATVPQDQPAQAVDKMSPYRTMAAEALAAFKSGDMAAAKTKSRELEKAWDSEQKDLKAKSPDTWKAVDDAMDAFIKPLMKEKSPDAAKVQAAYDEFIAKLDAAARS